MTLKFFMNYFLIPLMTMTDNNDNNNDVRGRCREKTTYSLKRLYCAKRIVIEVFQYLKLLLLSLFSETHNTARWTKTLT